MASQKMEISSILAKSRFFASYLFGIIFLIFAHPEHSTLYLSFSLSGLVLRVWASGCIEKGKTLCKTGPYSIVRHPLYLGTFLIGLGIVLTSSIKWITLYIILFLLFYGGKLLEEERELERKFGDEYREYKREVPAFFPKRLIISRGEFSIKKVIRNREYNVWLGLASFLIIYYYLKG